MKSSARPSCAAWRRSRAPRVSPSASTTRPRSRRSIRPRAISTSPSACWWRSTWAAIAAVMSRPNDERPILDAGLKALSVDSGMPIVHGFDEADYSRASDEHGKVLLKRATNALRVGDKVKLVPGHCDPTVNLYDWYVGVRK